MTGSRRARWAAASLAVAIVLSIGTIWLARRAVGADIEQLADRAVDMALAQRPAGSGASEEQMRSQMRPFMRGMLSLYPAMVTVGILVWTALVSTILMGAWRVAGVPVRWPMAFTASAAGTAASALAQFCVTIIVVFVVQRAIPVESLLDNSIVPLSVAAFLPAETSAIWRSAASKLDLLQLVFVIALVSYLVDEEGFARDARKIAAAIIVCYLLWIGLGMLWAAAWSGLAGSP
jgi:hypothetical protein